MKDLPQTILIAVAANDRLDCQGKDLLRFGMDQNGSDDLMIELNCFNASILSRTLVWVPRTLLGRRF